MMFTAQRLRWIAMLALLQGIAACTRLPETPQPEHWPDRVDRLTKLTDWTLQGKLAVTWPEGRESARLQWTESRDHFTIRFSGPVGIGAAHIHGNADGVTFERGDRRKSAETAEELSEMLLGWPLPVESLRYWVRGIPAPKGRVHQWAFDEQGHLIRLDQHGWQLTFSDYARMEDGTDMPERIAATHGDIELLLLVKNWQPALP